jgi:tetratricopeptide (TPR) repeat protein
MNLASAGRKLIFPASDPKRLQAALFVFEVSIETDKTFFGGYAGAAQVLALSALASPIEQRSREALIASKTMVEASEDLAPEAAWTHSARASYEWAAGNFDNALTKSSTARLLDPKDAHLLEFDALISLFAGRFDRVIESVETRLGQVELPKSSVFNNALGSAYFHFGNSEKCISVFEAAIAAGAPTGPITVAYLAAAHQRLGNQEQASKRVRQIIETWPKYRLDLLFEKLFQNTADSDFLIDNLRDAGWRPDGKPA